MENQLTSKDRYIKEFLMPLSQETLRFMVADLHFYQAVYDDCLVRIRNILATVSIVDINPETDLGNSQSALFEISIIIAQVLLTEKEKEAFAADEATWQEARSHFKE